jgi:hypothetical protein
VDKDVPWVTGLSHTIGALTRPITDRLTYTTRSGIASGLKRTGGFGFLPRETSDEERFYLSLDLTGKVVYDNRILRRHILSLRRESGGSDGFSGGI